MAEGRLSERRRRLEQAWARRFGAGGAAQGIRPEIRASWERSRASAPVELAAAPVDESVDPVALWRDSPLRPAIESVGEDIRELVEDRGFVAAVMDDRGRILWTAGSRHMRQRAERVNFGPGGRWDERSVGTNALALALDEDRPSHVFSAEHYAPMVHGWCCFAAPLHDPVTRRPIGVLDLSSTWERAHPMALATVRALALAAQAALDASAGTSPALPRQRAAGTVEVRVLGRPELSRSGVVVPLSLRHSEIVALLALARDGLSPEQLHDQLHGAAPVAVTTTKAEVSHVRSLLAGGVTQRRYALTPVVQVDVLGLAEALRAGDVDAVASLYRGPLLPASDAPGVREWREALEVGVRELALRTGDLRLAEGLPHDLAVQEAALARLGPGDRRAGWALAQRTRAAHD